LCPVLESLDHVEDVLKRQKVDYGRSDEFAEIHGVTFSTFSVDALNTGLMIKLDPGVVDLTLPIVEAVLNAIHEQGACGVTIQLVLDRIIRREGRRHRLTGCLYGTGTKITKADELERGNVRFFPHEEVNGQILLNLELLSKRIPTQEIGDLYRHPIREGSFICERQINVVSLDRSIGL
jgi:hypothetical protein